MKTKKLTPNVKTMLDRAEAMEREAGLLRQLAKAESQLAHYRSREARRARSARRTSSRPLDA